MRTTATALLPGLGFPKGTRRPQHHSHPWPGARQARPAAGGGVGGVLLEELSCSFASHRPHLKAGGGGPFPTTPGGLEVEASGCLVWAPRRPGGTLGSKTLPTLPAAPDRGWCSTWGAGHFSTFDGHVYDFSGTCNYIFAATCEDASSTFSVQLRRGPSGNISRVIVELGASVVTVQQGVISVKDEG